MYQFYEEIKQQPDLFQMLYELECGHIYDIAKQVFAYNPKKIFVAGCGDAYSNALLCKEYMDHFTGSDHCIQCEGQIQDGHGSGRISKRNENIDPLYH